MECISANGALTYSDIIENSRITAIINMVDYDS